MAAKSDGRRKMKKGGEVAFTPLQNSEHSGSVQALAPGLPAGAGPGGGAPRPGGSGGRGAPGPAANRQLPATDYHPPSLRAATAPLREERRRAGGRQQRRHAGQSLGFAIAYLKKHAGNHSEIRGADRLHEGREWGELLR